MIGCKLNFHDTWNCYLKFDKNSYFTIIIKILVTSFHIIVIITHKNNFFNYTSMLIPTNNKDLQHSVGIYGEKFHIC